MFEKNTLNGLCGIVTGASSGIGYAIAEFLLAHGAKVTITGRNLDKLEAAAKSLGCHFAAGDVRKAEDVKAGLASHLAKYGRCDFLVNNAAGNFLCPLEQMTENAFRSVNDIVCLGTFLWAKAVYPVMKAQGFGRIVNTGTNYAFGHGAYVGHSGAAKAAVLNLTKTMAVEWGPEGITSNMIAPGPVEGTEGVRRLMGDPTAQKMMLRMMPTPRMAKGSEIGAAACFLISPLGAYINGCVLPVDGGLHLVNPGLMPTEIAKAAIKAAMEAKAPALAS